MDSTISYQTWEFPNSNSILGQFKEYGYYVGRVLASMKVKGIGLVP